MHSFGFGGTDRVAAHLANGFMQFGYDVHLLLFCDGGNAYNAMTALLNDGVQVSYLGHRGASRTKDLIRLLPRCIAWLKQHKPDAVLSTCNNMNWMTAIAVKRGSPKSKLIMKTTNPIVREKDRGLGAFLRRRGYQLAFKSADRVLALCNVERDLLASQFPTIADRFAAVANPYVTPEMITDHDSQTMFVGKKMILGVGRFETQKNMELLIRSFAALQTLNAVLVILGEGALKAACEALVKELGLSHKVEMPGFVEDPTPWFRRADVFALSSIYEGFPAVVLEAMAVNCPIVSTNCFLSAKPMLDPLAGCRVVTDASPQTVAHALDAALEHPRNNCLRATAQKYSIAAGTKSHAQYIAETLGVSLGA